MRKAVLISTALLLNLSCLRKEVPLYPPGEPTVVLNSIMNPKDEIAVSLKYSTPLERNAQLTGSNIIRNAEVLLYENNKLVDSLKYRDLVYKSKVIPNLDATYKIVGVVPEWERPLEASTKIPSPADIHILDVDSVKYDDETMMSIKLNVDSVPLDVFFDIRVDRHALMDSPEPIHRVLPIIATTPKFEFLQNELFVIPAKNIKSKNHRVEILVPSPPAETVKDSLVVKFISINKDFYKYLRDNSDRHGDLLMFSYDQTYTNVENGIGIFTGVSFSEVYHVEN